MIQHPAFPVEPWAVRETELHLDKLAQTESVFALSNGHIGLRGNLDEGEPFGLPGTYLDGFYEVRPLPYAEAGYGFPEAGQTVLNVTNGKIIRLLVEDEPFDVRYGTLRSHERVLDLRAGVLRRTAEWVSPTGTAVRVSSTRMVSFAQRAVAAILYEVEPLEQTIPVVVQSELFANEPLPDTEADPRAAAMLSAPLRSLYSAARDTRAILAHVTTASGLTMAAAMEHVIDGPPGTDASEESSEDLARVMVSAEVAPGTPLRVIKFLAYGWSSQRSMPSIRDQVSAALAEARHTGWDALLAAQRAYLDDFWARVRRRARGRRRAAAGGALRTVSHPAGGRARRAAGHRRQGPDGTGLRRARVLGHGDVRAAGAHLHRAPRGARCAALATRDDRPRPRARAAARLPGRRVPVADDPRPGVLGVLAGGHRRVPRQRRHRGRRRALRAATGDEAFERDAGLELLVETARLWRVLGHHDAAGRFRIDGVTGPDEYSAIADNNVYTNLMAQRNLRAAAEAAERQPDLAAELGVDDEETAGWRDAAQAMLDPVRRPRWASTRRPRASPSTRSGTSSTRRPSSTRCCCTSPTSTSTASRWSSRPTWCWRCTCAATPSPPEQKARDFDYYERLTVRDSSLSACIQAVVAAEVGHLELAYDYLGEAALMDLDDLEHNTRDGLHIASLAGTWIGAVAGLGGMRDHGGILSFAPRLPQELTRLAFRVCFRDRRLLVNVEPAQATYTLTEGSPLDVVHHGERATVHGGRPWSARSPHPRPASRRASRPAAPPPAEQRRDERVPDRQAARRARRTRSRRRDGPGGTRLPPADRGWTPRRRGRVGAPATRGFPHHAALDATRDHRPVAPGQRLDRRGRGRRMSCRTACGSAGFPAPSCSATDPTASPTCVSTVPTSARSPSTAPATRACGCRTAGSRRSDLTQPTRATPRAASGRLSAAAGSGSSWTPLRRPSSATIAPAAMTAAMM